MLLAALLVWAAMLVVPAGATASVVYYAGNTSRHVFPLAIATDGSLSPIACPGSNCSTPGLAPAGEAVTPDGRFLYAGTFNGNVVAFAIASDGSLSPIACPSNCNTGGSALQIAITPDGRFLYAAVQGVAPGRVAIFAIAADGSLSPVACPGSTCDAGAAPVAPVVTPNGKFLYLTNGNADSISIFQIGADGTLTPVTCPGTSCNTGSAPRGLVITPDGRFLYTDNDFGNTVSGFTVGSDGTLSPISCSGSNCNTGFGPSAVSVSPDGRHLYTANVGGTVSVFAIASDGSLSPVACAGCSNPSAPDFTGLAIEPSSRFVYTATGLGNGLGTLSVFAAAADGSLSSVGCPDCTTGAQSNTQALVVSPDQAPVAAFTARPTASGGATTFDASGSSASPGRTVARYDWNFGDGTTAANAGSMPSHSYTAVGNYTVTLTVTDDAGCSTALVFTGETASCNGGPSAQKTLTIRIAQPPTVQIAAPVDGTTYRQGQAVSSIFSCSEGANGPGLLSCLDQNAHPSGATIDTSTAGAHTFTVTATSTDGQSSSRSVTYEVMSPSAPPPPPSNRFVVSRVKARANGSVSFNVTVPGAGTIDVLETAWKNNFATAATLLQPATGRLVFARSHRTATRGSTIHLKVRPNKRGRQLVAHYRYKVRIRLWVTYKPTAGRQRSIGFYGLRITR